MKKIMLIALLTLGINQTKAQTWVTLNDTAFISYLHSIIPAAMHSDSLNTSSPLVANTTLINVFNKGIFSLNGVQYFTSLQTLICNDNYNLHSLPVLPSSLTWLDCSYTTITNLTGLPGSLTHLNISGSIATSFPVFPNSITFLDCSYASHIAALPTLPASLQTLYCDFCRLTSLPVLPSNLQTLTCGTNSLTSLPALPASLKVLNCNSNYRLKNLPALPNGLTGLYCMKDSLSSLPILPNTLQKLDCSYNNITCFAPFSYLNVLYLDPNPFTCLPNYIYAMGNDTANFPLCTAGNTNGCAVVAGIHKFDISNQVKIYPNPAQNIFSVEVSDDT
jgi:Leucine-rich repeat (LRR) protein